MTGEHTLSVDPQQRSGRFPILERGALGEPYPGAFVMSTARNVVIYGCIWRSEPFREVLYQCAA